MTRKGNYIISLRILFFGIHHRLPANQSRMFSEESTDFEDSALPFASFHVSDGDPVPESSSPLTYLDTSSSPLIGSWNEAYEEEDGGSAKESILFKGDSESLKHKIPESTSPSHSSAYHSSFNCDGDSEGESEVSTDSASSNSSLGALSQTTPDRFAFTLQAKLLVLKRRQEMYPTTSLFIRRYPTASSAAASSASRRTVSPLAVPVIPKIPPHNWRVIKRTYSGAYMRDESPSQAATSDFGDHAVTLVDAKRRKTVGSLRGGASGSAQFVYAHRSASLRRAESLKSTISSKGKVLLFRNKFWYPLLMSFRGQGGTCSDQAEHTYAEEETLGYLSRVEEEERSCCAAMYASCTNHRPSAWSCRCIASFSGADFEDTTGDTWATRERCSEFGRTE